MAKHITVDTVPEIWFKLQRVIRTALAVTLSIVITLAAGIGSIQVFAPQIFTELGKFLPPEFVAWLVGFFGFLVIVAGSITRIMAIPQVNAWLTKIGAGSVPKAAIAATPPYARSEGLAE